MNSVLQFSTIFFSALVFNPSHGQSPEEVARQMFQRLDQVKSLSYEMRKTERINGKMRKQRAFIKLHRDPFKVYIRQIQPDEGIEVLFREGDETALINPSGFPWFNVRLQPLSSRMIKDRHHTIHNSGFDYFAGILQFLFNKYHTQLDQMTTISSSKAPGGEDCWVLKFNNPYFKFVDYTVKKGESVLSIAEKLHVSAYMILETNPTLEGYFDVSEGQVLQVPNDYSPHMTLYIDKSTHVPLLIKVQDQKGLFQQYEFHQVRIDPPFQPDEFNASYPDYGF